MKRLRWRDGDDEQENRTLVAFLRFLFSVCVCFLILLFYESVDYKQINWHAMRYGIHVFDVRNILMMIHTENYTNILSMCRICIHIKPNRENCFIEFG